MAEENKNTHMQAHWLWRLISMGKPVLGPAWAVLHAFRFVPAALFLLVAASFGKYKPESFKHIAEYWDRIAGQRVKKILGPPARLVGVVLGKGFEFLKWFHHKTEEIIGVTPPFKNYLNAMKKLKTPEGVFWASWLPGPLIFGALVVADVGLTAFVGMPISKWVYFFCMKYVGGAIAMKGLTDNAETLRKKPAFRMMDDAWRFCIDRSYDWSVRMMEGTSISCMEIVRKSYSQSGYYCRKFIDDTVLPHGSIRKRTWSSLKGFLHRWVAEPWNLYFSLKGTELNNLDFDYGHSRYQLPNLEKGPDTNFTTSLLRAKDVMKEVIDFDHLGRDPAKYLVKVIFRDSIAPIAATALPDITDTMGFDRWPYKLGKIPKSLLHLGSWLLKNTIRYPVYGLFFVPAETFDVVYKVGKSDNPVETARSYKEKYPRLLREKWNRGRKRMRREAAENWQELLKKRSEARRRLSTRFSWSKRGLKIRILPNKWHLRRKGNGVDTSLPLSGPESSSLPKLPAPRADRPNDSANPS